MMGGTVFAEFFAMGAAMLSGALITLVYDALRIFRRVIAHGNVWIGIEDGVFWLWTSFWIFSVLYRINDGAFRLYTIAAMLAGMLVYHGLIGEVLVCFLSLWIKRITAFLGRPIKKLKIYIIILGNKLKKCFGRSIMKSRQERQSTDDGGMSDDKDGT